MTEFNKVVKYLCTIFELTAFCAACVIITHQYDQIQFQEQNLEIMEAVYEEWFDKMEEHHSEIDDLNESYQEEISELNEEITDLKEEIAEYEAYVDVLDGILDRYDFELVEY